MLLRRLIAGLYLAAILGFGLFGATWRYSTSSSGLPAIEVRSSVLSHPETAAAWKMVRRIGPKLDEQMAERLYSWHLLGSRLVLIDLQLTLLAVGALYLMRRKHGS